MKASRVYILLPAYNEEAALCRLIPELVQTLQPQGTPFTICLVDDGSRDETPAFARNPAVQYLRHDQNSGYGAAIKTGVLWVIRNARPEDVLVTMDADNTHPPATLAALIAKLDQGCEVATASYTLPGCQALGVPFKRRFLSRGANALLRLRFRFPGIGTYTNGFRAYRVGALQKVHQTYGDRLIEQSSFAGGTELFIKTLRAGASAGEIPFDLHYERRGGGSKINISRTILAYLKLLQVP